MFLVFALIATMPLMAMSYLALAETRAAVSQEVGGAHEDAAKAAAGYAALYVQNGRVLLDATATSTAMKTALSAQDQASLVLALQGLVDHAQPGGGPIFESAFALNETGRVVAAYPALAAPVGADRSSDLAFVLPRLRNALATLPVTPSGPPLLPLASPVSVQGAFRGVVVANLRLSALGDALQAFAPGGSQTVFLVEPPGRLIAHANASLAESRLDWSQVDPVRRALHPSGEAPYVEYDDPVTGQRALGAYATVPDLGWAVVDTVPLNVAYAGLTRLSAVLIVFVGILAGAILLSSVLIARRIVRPVQELTEAAKGLSAGKLASRIEPSGNDEIAELGATFNEMAERITESLDGLRRSEARYRNLVESANDLIFTVQPDGELSFISPLAERVLGQRPSDLVGRSAYDLVAEGDRATLRRAVASVVERGAPVLSVPFRLMGLEGVDVAVVANLSPVFDSGPSPTRVLGVAHDVTRERREELIREKSFQMARLVSEERALAPLAASGLSLIASLVPVRKGAALIGSPDALREVAFEGSLTLDSRRALAGLARDAMRTRAPEARDMGDERAVALPLLEQGEALGALVLVGEPRRLDDPAGREVLAALASQLAVGIRRSLFEERLREHAASLEARVAERTAELTEKSREIESFLYSVSHDLKAPLISIQGYAQSLEEDYGRALAGEGAQWLDRIRKNATLMESLILDILELSRIGRVRDQTEDVDMDGVLRDAGAALADRLAAAHGELRVQERLPAVHGERKRLQQLFTNLLDNAVKYRHPSRPPRIEVVAEAANGRATFSVKDNGRGIPERHLESVFALFHRAPSEMEDPGGTGVGLAIVKRIVDTHGGTIRVESVEGKGTTFHVTLPLAERPRRVEVKGDKQEARR